MGGTLQLPDGFERLRRGGVLAVVRSSVKDPLVASGLLDEAAFRALRTSGQPLGAGRGGAVALRLTGIGMVVIRHCRRGGLVRHVLGDRYFGGARPVEELCVSEAARAAGVPVAECLAARVRRTACGYSGDLVVRQVPNAVSLEEWLAQNPQPSERALRDIAAALADAFTRLVDARVYHPDLHAGNVLIEGASGRPGIRIIDFDKARRLPAPSPERRDQMLFRFNRALVKRGFAPWPIGIRVRMRFVRELGIEGSDVERRLFRRCAAHLRRHAWRYR